MTADTTQAPKARLRAATAQDGASERGDWPSASAFAANSLCPGRHQAQIGLPEPDPGPDAETGTAIHAALAGAPTRPLSADDQETLEGIQARERAIVASWDPEGYARAPIRERRLWHWWEAPGHEEPLKFSGQPDVIYVLPPKALVIDFKTGRKPVEAEASNLQLRALAALVASQWDIICHEPITEVTVALAQHWSPAAPPCRYDLTDLAQAMVQAERLVESWYEPNAQRTPNLVSCQYCRAKATCPEFAAAALPVVVPPGMPLPTAENIEAAILAMPGDRLGPFLAILRLCDDVATAEVRKRIGEGASVQGWALSPGRTTEKIVDPQGLFNRFIAAGGVTEQFLACVTVGKGKLKDALREVSGAKGKALDGELARMLEGLTESKQSAPVLERE